MHEVVEHNHLIQMIEKVFPDMNAAMYQKIYQNLLKCVEKRDYVSVILLYIKNNYTFILIYCILCCTVAVDNKNDVIVPKNLPESSQVCRKQCNYTFTVSFILLCVENDYTFITYCVYSGWLKFSL